MVDQDMDWMNDDLLEFPCVLHNIPKHVEKLLTKYDPNKTVNVEDHLDKF